MSRDLHHRAGDLFLEARRLDRAAQARLLDERCAGDEALRQEVESLLAGDTQATPIDTPLATAGLLSSPLPTPDRIGRFQILGVLGEGGMGVVYRAQQDQPRRVVALKILRLASGGPQLLRRFEREGEALARLHHPGIAQVYEVGRADTTWGACPYLAMELIEGPTITAYARAAGTTTLQRLALLALVADALHHAHTKGVIHRDLKPANILVEESQTGTTTTLPAQPKLLDFGVARLAEEGRDVTAFTDTGQLVGTLRYMSPEQVGGDAHAADVRSDVYALGLVGYELLTGERPYDLEGKPLAEASRIIREQEPRRPSLRDRTLAGDPEIILLKALEKDPDRRYASAAEFAADIRRLLADQPITARPASAAYQLRKFARRNRALVGVVAIGAAALTLVAGASLYAAVTASNARHKVEQSLAAETAARTGAQREADKSRRALDFIRDMLASSHPGREGADVRVVEVLNGFAKKVGAEFDGQPDAEADVRHTIGVAYQALGQFPQAREQLERAVDLRTDVLGIDHIETVDSRLALCDTVLSLRKEADALTLATEIRQRRAAVSGEDDLRVLHARDLTGQALTLMHKSKEAEEEYRRALAIADHISASDSTRGATLVNLALSLGDQGRNEDSRAVFQQAIDLLTSSKGGDDPLTLSARCYLAMAECRTGHQDLGLARFEQVLADSRRVWGREHSDTILVESNMANAYMDAGRYADGVPLLEHCRARSADLVGADNPRTLTYANNLASAYQFTSRFDEATQVYSRVLESQTRVVGADHQSTLITRNNMARVLLKQKRPQEALDAYLLLIPDADRVLAGSWFPAAFRLGMGQSLADLGRRDEAEPVLVEAAAALEGKLGKSHPYAVKAREAVAALYDAWGKPDQAAKFR